MPFSPFLALVGEPIMPPRTSYNVGFSSQPLASYATASASSPSARWHHNSGKPHNNNMLSSISDLSLNNSAMSSSGAAEMAVFNSVNHQYQARTHTPTPAGSVSFWDTTAATSGVGGANATMGSASFENDKCSPPIITSPVFTRHADNDLVSCKVNSSTTDNMAPAAQPPLSSCSAHGNTDDDLLFWKHNPVKPSIPYRTLVVMSLQAAGAQGSTLTGIYEWIEANFMYFSVISEQGSGASWRSSIRHNLVSHKEFVRLGSTLTDDDDAADNFETKAGNLGGTGRRARWILSPAYVHERSSSARPDSPPGMGTGILGDPPASKPRPRNRSKSAIRTAKSGPTVYAGDSGGENSSTASSPRVKSNRQRSISVNGSKMRRGVSVPTALPYALTASRESSATLPTIFTEPPLSNSLPALPEGASLETFLGLSLTFESAQRSPPCAGSHDMVAQHHPTRSSASSTTPTYPASNVDDHFIMAQLHASIGGHRRALLVTPMAGEMSDAEINNIAMWLMDQ